MVGYSFKLGSFAAVEYVELFFIVIRESSTIFYITNTTTEPTKAMMDDRRARIYRKYNNIVLLYSQNPSMTTAAASHTYRTVTLTRYTLNYATLPDGPHWTAIGGKKNVSKTIITRYYYRCCFFSPSGAICVGSCCTCTHAA